MLDELESCIGQEILVVNRGRNTQWDYGDSDTTEAEFQYHMILREVQPDGIRGELLGDLAIMRKGSMFFHPFRTMIPEGPTGTNAPWQGPVDKQLARIEYGGKIVYEAS
ncbi:MAG: hypothetical protein AAB733_02275 [Patescibacteria group bacterium]